MEIYKNNNRTGDAGVVFVVTFLMLLNLLYMKKLIVYCGLPLMIFLFSAGMVASPQDPPGTKKEVKVIVVKKGEDSVVYSGSRKVILPAEEMEGDTGEQVRVFVRRFGSGKKDSLFRNPGWRNFRYRNTRPMAPWNFRNPAGPGTFPLQFQQNQPNQSINLADPGILSYKKKKLSGGREKITIIRKEVTELKKEENQLMQFEHPRNAGGNEELRKMNAPRRVRELDLNRRDLPKPSEITPPEEKK